MNMACYERNEEREKEFINMLLAIGIKSYGSCDDNGNTYWFFFQLMGNKGTGQICPKEAKRN